MSLTPDDLAFLEDLERQLGGEAVDQRMHERLPLRLPVGIRPADTSRAHEAANAGHTVNVSLGGLSAEMARPARVGDHYLVRLFTKEDEPVEVVGRCLRVSLVSETSFEVAIAFVAPLKRKQLDG